MAACWPRPRHERAMAFRTASLSCAPLPSMPFYPMSAGVLAAVGTTPRSRVPTENTAIAIALQQPLSLRPS
eukprot:10432436-Alexandrium_andersonii.AAC.1